MSFTFGRTTTTSSYGSATANNKYGGKFTLSTEGYLQSITAYISAAAGGAAPVRYGCYDADTFALVAVTEPTTLPAGTGLAWVTLNVAVPPLLPVGDYILCAHAGSNYLDIRRDLTGGISGYVWDLYSDSLNNPWGTWSPSTKHYCIYGTLTVPDPPPPPPEPGPVASSQQMVLYVEAEPPTETTLDVLRIYKGNGTTYTDITSSTIQGFADIRKTDVLNGPGSLDFSLAASTVKQLNTWIDENSVVELWSAGVRVGCYYVDEYTPSWASCSATVKCLGALSLAGRVLYDSVNVPITVDDLAMAALVTEVDASNTGTVWRFDEELLQLGSTGVAVAASGNSALDWLATVGPMISGRFWVDADWYFNAAILKDPDVDAVDKTYAMGTNGQDFRTTYSARAIYNYLTVLCPNAEAPGYVICLDETSQGIYGIRAAKTTYSDATTLAMGTAYGNAQLATIAYPQLSVTVLGNHDPAVTSGMLAEVTGLDDGRTYKGIVQQISWRVGDLTDEIIMSAQPLSLNTAVSAGFNPNERVNLGGNSIRSIYAQAAAPTVNLRTGELWFDTDAYNQICRWNGTAWVSMRDGLLAAAVDTWTPSWSCGGSMSISSVNLWYATYARIGPYVWMKIRADFTLGGAPSTSVKFTLPVNAALDEPSPCFAHIAGADAVGIVGIDLDTQKGSVYLGNFGNWSTGIGRQIGVNIWYQAA